MTLELHMDLTLHRIWQEGKKWPKWVCQTEVCNANPIQTVERFF